MNTVPDPKIQHPRDAVIKITACGSAMTKLDDRAIATLDFVLEETCKVFLHGGDHERRRYIARILKISAKGGNSPSPD